VSVWVEATCEVVSVDVTGPGSLVANVYELVGWKLRSRVTRVCLVGGRP
jgi:hypothetical protein